MLIEQDLLSISYAKGMVSRETYPPMPAGELQRRKACTSRARRCVFCIGDNPKADPGAPWFEASFESKVDRYPGQIDNRRVAERRATAAGLASAGGTCRRAAVTCSMSSGASTVSKIGGWSLVFARRATDVDNAYALWPKRNVPLRAWRA